MIANSPTPPLGWNSFDCYGIFANERVLLENLDAFEKKLKPHGYAYFVLDAGWYSHFEIPEGREFPINKVSVDNEIDAYGRLVFNPSLFPHGMKYIADRVHEKGLKFGIHIMRGIPRKAVELNTPIKGTRYHARDIADTDDRCSWNEVMYGVDMDKPGAQEYYNSVLELLEAYEIDFLKADDLTPFPKEVEGIAKAVEHVKRPIVYSLSPGNDASPVNADSYRRANMLRISGDVWDEWYDIVKVHERWLLWEKEPRENFRIDLDMIPFGALQVYADVPENDETTALLAGHGIKRMCKLDLAQKQVFITARALAASPLMMGGELTMTPDEDIALITHKEILACNRNDVCATQIYHANHLDVRKAAARDNPAEGWLGIFKYGGVPRTVGIAIEALGFPLDSHVTFHDIWNERELPVTDGKLQISLAPRTCLFVKFRAAS